MAPRPLLIAGLGLASAGAVFIASPSPARAQTMGANSAQYNAGYGRTAGQENSPVNVSMRDANGNLVVANGFILSGSSSSVFASSGGVGSASTGVSSSTGATAVGNSLTVVTTGNYNTVIVNSKQTNTGAITATTTTSGGVGNGQ
jgi:holdfast attachment protein HfaA